MRGAHAGSGTHPFLWLPVLGWSCHWDRSGFKILVLTPAARCWLVGADTHAQEQVPGKRWAQEPKSWELLRALDLSPKMLVSQEAPQASRYQQDAAAAAAAEGFSVPHCVTCSPSQPLLLGQEAPRPHGNSELKWPAVSRREPRQHSQAHFAAAGATPGRCHPREALL